jgi:hypothetical protein
MRNLLAQRVRPKDNHIHWHAIHVGRDFGTQLEVLDGLAETTKVVMNPTDDLREGVQVQPVEKPKPWQQRRANHFPADELDRKQFRKGPSWAAERFTLSYDFVLSALRLSRTLFRYRRYVD